MNQQKVKRTRREVKREIRGIREKGKRDHLDFARAVSKLP